MGSGNIFFFNVFWVFYGFWWGHLGSHGVTGGHGPANVLGMVAATPKIVFLTGGGK